MERRHPELRPYTPPDRYGKATSRPAAGRPSCAAERNRPAARRQLDQIKREPINRELNHRKCVKSPAKSVASDERNLIGQNTRASKNSKDLVKSSRTTRADDSTTGSLLPKANGSGATGRQVGQTKYDSKPSASRIARISRRPDDRAHPPEDSGVEAESASLTDNCSSSSSSSSSSTTYPIEPDTERHNAISESQDTDRQQLAKAREHLDAMARKAANDRQLRLQLVDRILSKLRLSRDTEPPLACP